VKVPPQLQPHHPRRSNRAGILCQRGIDDGQLIFKLDGAEVVVCGLGKIAPAHAHAAIVGGAERRSAFCASTSSRQQRVAPSISHVCTPGRRRDSRSEAQKLDLWRLPAKAGLHREACHRRLSLPVARAHGADMAPGPGWTRRDCTGRGLAQPKRGRLHARRKLVDEAAICGCEVSLMGALAGGELLALAGKVTCQSC